LCGSVDIININICRSKPSLKVQVPPKIKSYSPSFSDLPAPIFQVVLKLFVQALWGDIEFEEREEFAKLLG
jgi:hypothetical protein